MIRLQEIISLYPEAKQSLIQLCVYRNYNCAHDKIYQASTFETKPHDLLKFWKNVKVEGGMGHQAL